MIVTNILGTDYAVRFTDTNDPALKRNDGICCVYAKEIVLRKKDDLFSGGESRDVRDARFDEVLLHEIIHAYARETGNSFDDDEELVEYLAFMIPKMVRSYDDCMKQFKEMGEL